MDEHDPLAGPSWGRSAEDKFLLSIIDAYSEVDPNPQRARQIREQRLSKARTALFNESPSIGPKPRADDESLRWMAREFIRDQALAALRGNSVSKWKRRSVRQLASKAAEKTPEDTGAFERLRAAFAANKDYLVLMERHDDDVRETIEYNIIEKIAKLMIKIDIRMRPDLGCKN
jgi:hypothetical protein